MSCCCYATPPKRGGKGSYLFYPWWKITSFFSLFVAFFFSHKSSRGIAGTILAQSSSANKIEGKRKFLLFFPTFSCWNRVWHNQAIVAFSCDELYNYLLIKSFFGGEITRFPFQIHSRIAFWDWVGARLSQWLDEPTSLNLCLYLEIIFLSRPPKAV